MKSKKILWIFFIFLQFILITLLSLGLFSVADTLGNEPLAQDMSRFPYEIFGLLIFWLTVFIYKSIVHLLSLSRKPAKPYIHPKTKKSVASWHSRVAAAVIDIFIINLPFFLAPYFIKNWSLWIYVSFFLLSQCLFLYDVLFDWLTGQTIGRKILKIKLYQLNGKKVSLPKALLRSAPNILQYAFSVIIFLLAIPNLATLNFTGISYETLVSETTRLTPLYEIVLIVYLYFTTVDLMFILFRKDRRALHDIISQTIVVKEKR